jgi:four helix bundle protein
MTIAFEDLKVLQASEKLCDGVWEEVKQWDSFARDTIGNQFMRAVDSIGANIAEGYGRFHFGEKLQFFYYARGSLFESKYWLNRARSRNLYPADQARSLEKELSDLARSLNNLINSTRRQRNGRSDKTLRESPTPYQTNPNDPIFNTDPNTLPNY